MPNPVTIQLLEALLSGEWEMAEASQGTNRREASGLVAALLQWHLERGLRSLALVDRS
jgi:DNA repair protein RecO (recombination protein O)